MDNQIEADEVISFTVKRSSCQWIFTTMRGGLPLIPTDTGANAIRQVKIMVFGFFMFYCIGIEVTIYRIFKYVPLVEGNVLMAHFNAMPMLYQAESTHPDRCTTPRP